VRDISSDSLCTDLREGISSLSVELGLSHGRTVISRGESVSDPTTATKDIHTPYHLRTPGYGHFFKKTLIFSEKFGDLAANSEIRPR